MPCAHESLPEVGISLCLPDATTHTGWPSQAAIRCIGSGTAAQLRNSLRRCHLLTPRPGASCMQVAAVLVEKENIDGDEFQQIVLASQAQQYLKKDAPGISIPYQAA